MTDERIYTIPLTDAYERPKTRRAKIAMSLVKKFLTKHMKSEQIKIGDALNKSLWAKGIQKPPRRIRIHTLKENDIIYADLLDVELKTPSKAETKKKVEKEEAKKEKIKEERKERKSKTIQDEIKEESGKAGKEPVKEKVSDIEAKEAGKTEAKEERAKQSLSGKETGKA